MDGAVTETSGCDSDFGARSEESGGEADPAPFAVVVVELAAEPPFVSRSGLLLAECASGGELFVGVAISIGSPGEGADIWMVGVMIGIVLVVIGSSGPSTMRGKCADSVAAVIVWQDRK